MEVLQQSFQLYRKSFWNCFPLSLFIAIGIYAPFLFFEYTHASDVLTQLFSWQDYKSALLILVWLLTFIASSALTIKLNSIKVQHELSIPESCSRSLAEFFPLLMIAILYALIVICGILFLVIPGIILSISLMFSFILRLIEHREVFESLLSSHRLVWGHWWYSLVIISIPFLLNLFLFLAIFISVVGIMTNFTATWEHAYFFAFLLNALIQVLFIPFIIGTALCLLYDLKTKKIGKQ